MYTKLTNEQLDLASSYDRWQQERFGNILVPPSIEPEDPEDDMRIQNQMEIDYLIETERL